MMVRPERLGLTEQAPGDGRNVMGGRLTEATFLGDNVTYTAKTAGGVEFRIKSSDQVDGRELFREGTECVLTWNIADTHVFADWDYSDIQRQLA